MQDSGPVTAIDIVLEPGPALVDRAERVNAELRTVYPEGFALDEAHRPHVTMLQTHVHTDRLAELFGMVGERLDGVAVHEWSLVATRYYYLTLDDLGVAGIVLERTPAMLELQRAWIDVAAPFTAPKGDARAFVRTEAEPDINQPTIDYSAAFAAEYSGSSFNPHVTVGVAPRTYLDPMIELPFDGVSAPVAGVSVYQLGNMGTAAKWLHTWVEPA